MKVSLWGCESHTGANHGSHIAFDCTLLYRWKLILLCKIYRICSYSVPTNYDLLFVSQQRTEVENQDQDRRRHQSGGAASQLATHAASDANSPPQAHRISYPSSQNHTSNVLPDLLPPQIPPKALVRASDHRRSDRPLPPDEPMEGTQQVRLNHNDSAFDLVDNVGSWKKVLPLDHCCLSNLNFWNYRCLSMLQLSVVSHTTITVDVRMTTRWRWSGINRTAVLMAVDRTMTTWQPGRLGSALLRVAIQKSMLTSHSSNRPLSRMRRQKSGNIRRSSLRKSCVLHSGVRKLIILKSIKKYIQYTWAHFLNVLSNLKFNLVLLFVVQFKLLRVIEFN